MTNKEAYERDLNESIEAIHTIISAVPQAKSKKQKAEREKIEYTASQAIATLECMHNDYIIKEIEAPAMTDRLKNVQDTVRLVQALLEAVEDSIRRSIGRGIAPEDMSMYLRALCSDVKTSANMLGEIVEK